MNITDLVNNICHAFDYLRCNLTANAAYYRAVYFEHEIIPVGTGQQVNIKMRAVIFDADDKPSVPGCRIIPDTNILTANTIEDMIFEANTGVVFILEARLFGRDNESVSLWDIRKNRRKRLPKIYRFVKNVLQIGNKDVQRGSISNRPPVSYKQLPQIPASTPTFCEKNQNDS